MLLRVITVNIYKDAQQVIAQYVTIHYSNVQQAHACMRLHTLRKNKQKKTQMNEIIHHRMRYTPSKHMEWLCGIFFCKEIHIKQNSPYYVTLRIFHPCFYQASTAKEFKNIHPDRLSSFTNQLCGPNKLHSETSTR